MGAQDLRGYVMGDERLQPDERILAQARPNRRLLWGEILQAVTVFAITFLIPAPFGGPEPAGPGPDFSFLYYGAFGVLLESFYFLQRIAKAAIHVACTTYTLTTDRIYQRTQFFSTDLTVVPYEKISLLRLRRSLFERLLGINRLDVRAYGAEQGHLQLRGLPEPLPLLDLLRDRIRTHTAIESLVRSD